ncbi:hypothetical protein L484_022329 [Morus notabilis]|uniref:Uncharacterized protein n=1 Tax=Morus notabilis TaxID=981085 RepID=W9QJ52_9ROSA|nr:hypothetical protein L484_022329 [Morus notabilis]
MSDWARVVEWNEFFCAIVLIPIAMVSSLQFQKTEREKLEKLARKGPKPEETTSASSGGSATEAKPNSASTSGASTERVSTDKHRNYAVIAGVITAFGALGWYLKGSEKKPEIQED